MLHGTLTRSSLLQLLYKLAKRAKLKEKIEAMFNGEHINVTEDRAVLHVALRAPRDAVRGWCLQTLTASWYGRVAALWSKHRECTRW